MWLKLDLRPLDLENFHSEVNLVVSQETRASLIHGTERAGTDRFRVLFHGTDLQSSKVTNLIGIKATLEFHCAFAGAASRMVEETLCNRADDGCKGIIT